MIQENLLNRDAKQKEKQKDTTIERQKGRQRDRKTEKEKDRKTRNQNEKQFFIELKLYDCPVLLNNFSTLAKIIFNIKNVFILKLKIEKVLFCY